MNGMLSPSSAPDQVVEIDGQSFRRHLRGGGLVALTARVSPDAYVGPNAVVKDFALIRGPYKLEDFSIVAGNAKLLGRVRLRHHARVEGHAILRGVVHLCNHAVVTDDARVYGIVRLEYQAFIGRRSRLEGNISVAG